MIKMLKSTSPPLVTYINDYHDDYQSWWWSQNQSICLDFTYHAKEKRNYASPAVEQYYPRKCHWLLWIKKSKPKIGFPVISPMYWFCVCLPGGKTSTNIGEKRDIGASTKFRSKEWLALMNCKNIFLQLRSPGQPLAQVDCWEGKYGRCLSASLHF